MNVAEPDLDAIDSDGIPASGREAGFSQASTLFVAPTNLFRMFFFKA